MCKRRGVAALFLSLLLASDLFDAPVPKKVLDTANLDRRARKLAALIMGFILSSDGQVMIDDVPLNAERLYAWHRHIGYVAQDTFLFNDTGRANLLWAHPAASDAELMAALRTAAVEGFVLSFRTA